MSKSQHKKMMQEIRSSIEESMEEIKTDENFVSIKDITANKSFTEFNLIVNRKAYKNSMDGFAIFGIGISGMMHQVFDGASPEDYDVKVNIKGADTGEVFNTVNLPEDMEDME